MTTQNRPHLVPGPDHPITVTPSTDHVVVTVAGKTVADTRAALALAEADYPVAYYVPIADVDTALLERTDHSTYCPYKGDASYYSIPAGGDATANSVWFYEHPYDAVAEIVDHVAFYPDRVAIAVS